MSDTETSNDHHHEHGDWRRGRRGYVRLVFLLLFAIVIAAIAFTGESLGHHRGAAGATITVTGSGTVHGTPNTLELPARGADRRVERDERSR